MKVYENQHEVGEGVQAAIDKGYISKADDVWITSKVRVLGQYSSGVDSIRPSVDPSSQSTLSIIQRTTQPRSGTTIIARSTCAEPRSASCGSSTWQRSSSC